MSYCQQKTKIESLKFEIQILLTASNGETPETKVEDLKKSWNFVFDNCLIWSCVELQRSDLYSM
jgi:hypothetical protein